MTQFTIEQNEYLTQNIRAFYHTDYVAYRDRAEVENYPLYLLTLKNDPARNWSNSRLQNAQQEFLKVLLIDIPQISSQISKNPLTICVVPRAKADNTYNANQLLFKATVGNAVNQLGNNFIDGTNLIERHTNTKTTHIQQPIEGFNNDGLMPYAGITNATCHISNDVIGKDILLIDDIYTKTVNIDEDAIQSLLDKGATSVSFYAVGKTVYNH
jgi:hypothetical protein